LTPPETPFNADDFFDAAFAGTPETEAEVEEETEVAEPDEETTDEVDSEDGATEDETDVEDEGEELEADDDADEVAKLTKGRFKSGEEAKLAKSYTHLEAHYSKQVNDLKAAIETERANGQAQTQQAMQAMLAQVQQGQNQQQSSPLEAYQLGVQLEQIAVNDPTAAYNAALQTGDDALIQRVVNRVERGVPGTDVDGNPAAAQQLRADYQGRIMAMQSHALQTQLADQQQKLERAEAERTIATTMTQFNDSFEMNDEIKAGMGEFLSKNQDKLNFSSPEALLSTLETAYDAAFGKVARTAQANAPAAKQKQKQAQRNQSYVESGTPGRSKSGSEQASVADTFAADIVAEALASQVRNPFA